MDAVSQPAYDNRFWARVVSSEPEPAPDTPPDQGTGVQKGYRRIAQPRNTCFGSCGDVDFAAHTNDRSIRGVDLGDAPGDAPRQAIDEYLARTGTHQSVAWSHQRAAFYPQTRSLIIPSIPGVDPSLPFSPQCVTDVFLIEVLQLHIFNGFFFKSTPSIYTGRKARSTCEEG